MKLHLPLFIRKSVLACMLALSGIATTVVSGSLVAGSAMWAISSGAARAQGEVQSITITGNADARLTSASAGSLIIMNLQGTSAGRWLVGPDTTHNVLADVQIDSLSITDGSSSAIYRFTGDISGDGVFERTSNAKAGKQTYVFTGDMSQYSGNMNLAKIDDGSTFCFIGNQSGTGSITIVAGNTVAVDDAVMNNSTITSAGTFTVSGDSHIVGGVNSTGSLNVSGNATFAGGVICDGVLMISGDAQLINNGSFTFGGSSSINLARASVVTDAQRTLTYSVLSSSSTGASNFSSLSISNIAGLVTAGRDWSFNNDGTLVGVLNNHSLSYSGGNLAWDTSSAAFSNGSEKVAFTNGDDITFTGNSTVTLGEEIKAQHMTVADDAEVTISGDTGSLALAEAVVNGTLKLNKGGQDGAFSGSVDVYGKLHVNTGDVTGWSSTNGIKAINILAGGEMYVGVTNNQTGAGLAINLQGGSITGVSGANLDLGYGGTIYGYSSISALAADDATAESPTVSTISGTNLTLRQNHTTISVAENARLDILSGILVKGNKSDLNGEGAVPSHLLAGLVKTGAGELRLSGNNTYTQATTVAEGTLTLTGGASLASSSVTVNRGAVFKLDTAADTSINYANQISGSGLLLKTGAGSASIGGLADSFAGHIDLQQGTLSVGSPVVISSGRELSLGMTGAVLDSSLSLGDGKLSIDYSGSGAATSLNNSVLTLLGGTQLQLSSLGNGDGKTYELFAGIGSLLGRDGNALVLDDSNNAISNYFDSTCPGSGFWAGATLQLTDAGTLQLVLHNETVKEAITITSRQTNSSAYQYYAGIAFEDISFASSSSSAYGGAIFGAWNSTITLSDNGSVSFSGNTASSSDYLALGGAIYGDVTMTGNGDVSFSGNTASSSSSDSSAYGGAIFGGTITLSNNGSVSFSGNTAEAASSDYDASGGAIYGDVTMTGNGDVSFSGNTASASSYASGGAIDGSVTMTGNGAVSFSGNTASSSSSPASGGAIDGSVTMTGNGAVSFSGNTASGSYSVYGGAVRGDVTMTGNGDVIFSGNTASASSSSDSSAYGGAIFGGTITLSNNGSVSFSGNTATRGGAIYGDSGSTIALNNNGSVEFSGNTATSYGGAIYGNGDLSIRNNESVLFEKNVEKSGSSYRLRSIYSYGDVSLSAAAGKSITFRDSIYIGSGNSFKLNEVYEGTAQQGDIVFTGATMVDDLYTLKGNVAATAQEILNSRTTEVCAMTNLYGGRLRVEEGAIYQGRGITAMEGSAATVRVQNAELSHSGYDLTFNAGTTLELAGNNTIAGNVQMLGGSSLVFDNTHGNGTTDIIGSLSLGADVSIALGNQAYGSNEVLLYVLDAVSGWDAAHLMVQGNSYTADSFTWVDNLLVLNYDESSFNRYFNGSANYNERHEGNVIRLHYESLAFTTETSSSQGGAIYGTGSVVILLSDNGSVSFSGNTAHSEDSSAWGGAIYGGTITFYGGWDSSTITLSNNGSVVFEGNTASSPSSSSYITSGGAIYGGSYSTITLSNNGSVTFSGNTASGQYTHGGAIYGDVHSTITLSNNGSVTFSGNTAFASSSYFAASGGAIYTRGDLSIRNNDSVEFYQNAEVENGNTYRLRSIYADGGSDDEISLSAAAGKSITFRDSVYIASGSTVNLNADYTYLDEEGESVTIRQTGDIIFTGATTVDDLYTVKGNVAGTTKEIRLSRTTEVNTLTNLYGGRLRVEEGAIYQGQGITAMKGSGATVRVQNATLSQVGYDLIFNAGTALEVAGNSTIRGNVSLLADSLFKLEQAATLSLHETLQADAATLTVQGTALLTGSSTLNASLTLAAGATLDMDKLDAGVVTINGALTFGGKVEMGENLMAILNEMRGWEESVTLFTGIESLVLPQVVTSGDSCRVWVGDVFSNLAGNESYYIDFKADVGALLVVHVPEPTTTSLSLLVLAALAMRRRRG